ncbi:MAG: hypothetical protein ACHQNT_00830 [Bacteroidia bacterium]
MSNHKKKFMIVPKACADGTDLCLDKIEAQTIDLLGDYFTYASIACKIGCKEKKVKNSMEFLMERFNCCSQPCVQKRAYNLYILIIINGQTYLNEKFMVNPPPAASPQNETPVG